MDTRALITIRCKSINAKLVDENFCKIMTSDFKEMLEDAWVKACAHHKFRTPWNPMGLGFCVVVETVKSVDLKPKTGRGKQLFVDDHINTR